MMVDQWPCGRVVGPYFRSAKADELTGAEKRNYIFESCYHTTLVAALAGATCPYATGVKKEFSPEDI